jgi:folate-binding protein YgfZ
MTFNFQLAKTVTMAAGPHIMSRFNLLDLDRYSLLRVSGEDRITFLQGQLTQDLTRLTRDQSLLAGWATAKGRLLFVSQLMDWQDSVLVPVPAAMADAILRRLSMFTLRAKVEISIPDWYVGGVIGPQPAAPMMLNGTTVPPESGVCITHGETLLARVVGDPTRAWVISQNRPAPGFIDNSAPITADDDLWEAANIRAGIPQLSPDTAESFIPQMLNLDVLDGISFTKGCYVGQEIVARTQNLGRIKRRMYRFSTDSALAIPPGSTLYGPDDKTGKLVSIASSEATTELLAVLPITDSAQTWYADEPRQVALQSEPLPYALPDNL